MNSQKSTGRTMADPNPNAEFTGVQTRWLRTSHWRRSAFRGSFALLTLAWRIGIADCADGAVSPADLFDGKAAFIVEENREIDTDSRVRMHFLAFARDGLGSFYRDADGNYFTYYIRGKDVGLALTKDGVSFVDQGAVFSHDAESPAEKTLNSFPSVWVDGEHWYLATEAIGTPGGDYPGAIMLAESGDGRTWTNRRLILERSGGWEAGNVGTPCLGKSAEQWHLFYSGFDGTRVQIGLATGPDLGELMRANEGKPIIETRGDGLFAGQAGKRSILSEDGIYYMAYEVSSAKVGDDPNFDRSNYSTTVARSKDLVTWERLDKAVLPTSYAQFGNEAGYAFDGPEWFRDADGHVYLYFRVPGNRTRRAVLQVMSE